MNKNEARKQARRLSRKLKQDESLNRCLRHAMAKMVQKVIMYYKLKGAMEKK